MFAFMVYTAFVPLFSSTAEAGKLPQPTCLWSSKILFIKRADMPDVACRPSILTCAQTEQSKSIIDLLLCLVLIDTQAVLNFLCVYISNK